MKLTSLKSKPLGGVKVLVYGAPKTGKTDIAGRLAEGHDLLYFDGENGVETLLQLPDELTDRIDVVRIPDRPEKPTFINTMVHVLEGKAGKVCHEHGAWNCGLCRDPEAHTHVCLNDLDKNTIVVIDSVTQLVSSAINHIAKGHKISLTDGKFEFDHWGILGKFVNKIGGDIQNLPCNVVAISHEMEMEQPDKSKKLGPVGGTANVSKQFPRYFGHVIRTYVAGGKHQLHSTATQNPKVIAGNRAGLTLDSFSLMPLFASAEMRNEAAAVPVDAKAKKAAPVAPAKQSIADRIKMMQQARD